MPEMTVCLDAVLVGGVDRSGDSLAASVRAHEGVFYNMDHVRRLGVPLIAQLAAIGATWECRSQPWPGAVTWQRRQPQHGDAATEGGVGCAAAAAAIATSM